MPHVRSYHHPSARSIGIFHRPVDRSGARQLIRQAVEGATLDEIVAATGWQKHTARGAMSGALKKRLGLTITSEQEPDRGRVYRIPPDEGS